MKHRNDQTVCIAYPYATLQSSRFAHAKEAVMMRDAGGRRRIVTRGYNASGANVATPRNEIVEGLLNSETDYLWFIDTDMVFDDDILERLVASAHPVDRPIVGGLCFSLQNGMRARPTIYRIRNGKQVGVEYDYPLDQLYEVDATGTGCLLIHRSVFEKMAAEYTGAYPWFQESALSGLPIGEDITFCIRARSLGFPIFVDTSIKVGHEKSFVVDEDVYLAQRRSNVREHADPLYPTFAVVASKDRPEMLANLVTQLAPQADVRVYDNGYQSLDEMVDLADGEMGITRAHGWPLHRMWNHGIDFASACMGEDHGEWVGPDGPWNVLVINDDVEVAPDFVAQLEAALRSNDDNWIACPGSEGMTGWAFMLRGEAGLRLDEQFEWWYGDTDLAKQAHQAGKNIVSAPNALCRHLDPMRSSTDPVRLAQAKADEAKYAAKWQLDPDTLWLARHPDFGAGS